MTYVARMNKKEIKKEIKQKQKQLEELRKIVSNLEEQLNKMSRWKPTINEPFYFCSSAGNIYREVYYNHNDLIKIGNYFKTEKEARFEVERLKVIAELKEFTFKPDWKDMTQDKYAIVYNQFQNQVEWRCNNNCIQRNDMHFETREDIEEAIQQVGEDRIKKYLFGVEE